MKKLILLFALLTGIVTTSNLTAQTVIASGNCGANGDSLTWVLTNNRVLTISGSGEMAHYPSSSTRPWYAYR